MPSICCIVTISQISYSLVVVLEFNDISKVQYKEIMIEINIDVNDNNKD